MSSLKPVVKAVRWTSVTSSNRPGNATELAPPFALRIWLMGCAGMLSGRMRGSGVGCWVAQGLGDGSVSGTEGVSVAAGSGSVVAPAGG